MYLTGDESDFTLHTMNRTYKLHKAILTAQSPVLAAMFNQELTQKPTHNLWELDDDVLDLSFKYMYTGKLMVEDEKPSWEIIRKLLPAADMVRTPY